MTLFEIDGCFADFVHTIQSNILLYCVIFFWFLFAIHLKMDFRFVLPKSKKQLLEDADCSNYFVKQIFSADEIPAQLRGECIWNVLYFILSFRVLNFQFFF